MFRQRWFNGCVLVTAMFTLLTLSVLHMNKQMKLTSPSPKLSSIILYNYKNESGRCQCLVKPTAVVDSQEFQVVENGQYVFSAFYDDRIHQVRIMGITSGHEHNFTYCQLWYTHTDNLTIVDLEIDTNPEHHTRE